MSTPKKNSQGTISSNGVRVAFETRGSGEPALVFIHGWANDRRMWDDQMAYFSKTHTVIAMDLPAFGASGNNRQQWTMAAYGEDVAAIVKALHLDPVVLVGFSMGAPVAVETAIRIPDRVIGLVPVDSLQNVEMQFAPEMVADLETMLMDLITAPAVEKMKIFVNKNMQRSFERFLPMVKDIPKTGWSESFQNIFQWMNQECIAALKQIKAPVIAINSDRMPTNGEAFSRYVPSFQTKIVPGTGHMVMWDDAAAFNRLLEESIQAFAAP